MTRDVKKILKFTVLILFLLFIVGYVFFRSQYLIFGVEIRDVNIENGMVVEESTLRIKGNAQKATKITLNAREITIDKEGDFKETIALLPGYNIVTIFAEDKFGNTDEKVYKLIRN